MCTRCLYKKATVLCVLIVICFLIYSSSRVFICTLAMEFMSFACPFQFILLQYDNPLSKKLNAILNEIRRQRCSYLRYKQVFLYMREWICFSFHALSHILLVDLQLKILQKWRFIRLVSEIFPPEMLKFCLFICYEVLLFFF